MNQTAMNQSSPLPTAHTHTCANQECGHVWHCDGVGKGKVCQVFTAAKVNKEGPWCALCLHIEMAKRYAEARGKKLTVTLA